MQHYTRNTVEVREWCNRCNKQTMHRVDAPKLGPCLECIKKLEELRYGKSEVLKPPPATQTKLF